MSIELPNGNSPIIDAGWFAFAGLSNLVKIDKRVLWNCPQSKNMQGCFRSCTSLKTVPAGFFDKLTEATNFGGVFENCVSLLYIPDGLFSKNINAVQFNYMCSLCKSLKYIPADLFDNCTKVTTFERTFNTCSEITSKLPELWLSHPDAAHTDCFGQCIKAPNYKEAYEAGWSSGPKPALLSRNSRPVLSL